MQERTPERTTAAAAQAAAVAGAARRAAPAERRPPHPDRLAGHPRHRRWHICRLAWLARMRCSLKETSCSSRAPPPPPPALPEPPASSLHLLPAQKVNIECVFQ